MVYIVKALQYQHNVGRHVVVPLNNYVHILSKRSELLLLSTDSGNGKLCLYLTYNRLISACLT